MPDSAINDVNAKARRPSIVESFAIEGLYGYRSISLNSEYAATIVIAKNGSGKTTLIGALDAFLKGQFSRLKDLDFRSISCKLNGISETLVLSHDDILSYLDISADSEISIYARRIEVDPTSLLKFISEDYNQYKDDLRALTEDPIYSAFQRAIGYRHSEVSSTIDRLRQSLAGKSPRVEKVSKAVQTVLNEVEVVYLPTYRRVELSLLPENRELRRRRPRFKFAAGSLFTGDIQFGLSDIYERLSDLNSEILSNSNIGYRRSSASIINELIDGTFDNVDVSKSNIPSKDELILFFSRLKEGRRHGPFLDEVTVPNIEKIYSGDSIPRETNKFLIYFLSKLNAVIRATRDIERRVEDFVDSCNRYLSAQDETSLNQNRSEDMAVRRAQAGNDDKILRLDRRNMKVHAESLLGGRPISLEALSSGEKQMVSLFAKLYLYPGKKIVLIDEPELSLSMGWQRQILVDVMSAPLCEQIIAITHSPFVFDNELDPFARPLKIAVDIDRLPSPEDSDVDIFD